MKWAVWDESYEGEEASAVILDAATARDAAEGYASRRHSDDGMAGGGWTVKVRGQGTDATSGELTKWHVRYTAISSYRAERVEKRDAN